MSRPLHMEPPALIITKVQPSSFYITHHDGGKTQTNKIQHSLDDNYYCALILVLNKPPSMAS
uniref:Uncharacterized protein n=1 Tax=Arundo donax TaxID=35708 RepID=A0A0A9C4X0_ARUDO